ncbi:unnamed protein product [Acanthoscelides obtectus]|uniref:Uncharacterized protein n=1 Tax=Acanthoscelides obtectus TaxID=200917 RepID=A0A9P0MF61_ACAOB|nr:unnamed protein product [Acanthoscelides obtectus]CAK1640868.1 hypothetical protein AOBTE_LOCUS11984 [Acanthoscelides obtectus]
MDETYIHRSHTYEKSWSDNTNEFLHRLVLKGQRFITVHTGSENGFVEHAYLKFKSTSGEILSTCKQKVYEKSKSFHNLRLLIN